MIPSTKFLTAIAAMICVTIVEVILITQQVYDYLDWYFGFMGVISGGYTLSKYTQNVTLAGINAANGTKTTEVKENDKSD